MKKNHILSIVSLVSMLFSLDAMQAQTIYYDYTDGKVYFKLKDSYPIMEQRSSVGGSLNIQNAVFLGNIADSYHVTSLRAPFYDLSSSALQRTYEIEFTDIERVDELIENLQKTENIEYAEKVPYHRLLFAPNDPAFASSQWYLKKINAEKAWDYSKGKKDILVAITDNAMYINHPDMKNSWWVNPGEIANNGKDDEGNGYIDDINGWDAGNNDNNTNPIKPEDSHGTYCSGIAGATTNNTLGGASIGCGISIMAVKIWSDDGSKVNGFNGIKYATASKARVISCSWGSGGSSQTEQNVINDCYKKGVIFVGAAGNEGAEAKLFPAAYDNVIAVASSDQNDKKSSFSNYGAFVDITAPGSSIYGTIPNDKYSTASGTSAATPVVAGLCGLMLSLNPAATPAQIEKCLKSSATNVDNLNPSYAGKLGAGRIDAAAAMKCIASITTGIAGNPEESASLTVFPNPSEGLFYLGFEAKGEKEYHIRILNVLGEIIYEQKIKTFQGYYTTEINLLNHTKGIYLISMNDGVRNALKKVIIH